MESAFLSLPEVAAYLAINVSQARALVTSGDLPAIRIGGAGHYRIERAVLQGWIGAKYGAQRARACSLRDNSSPCNDDDNASGEA